MMMAGERSIVNIMAEANLGASTVKDEWKKAVAKGLVPKTEKISASRVRQATILRAQGKPVSRISGQPFLDPGPDITIGNESKVSDTGEKKEISEIPGGGQENPDLSGISEQISTSMKSLQLQLKNGLGAFDTRLKNVERAGRSGSKQTKSPTTTKTSTLDLRQEAQAPPPAETTEVTDDQEEDDDGEVPEGQTRVRVPDGTKDGFITFLPTPFAEQLAKQQKGLKLIRQDVDKVAGVGDNPYERKITLTGTGTRRVVEINPKCEILFDYFVKRHGNAPEVQSMTAFVNMCIEFFAWTQNTQIRIGQEEILHLSPIFESQIQRTRQ